jgi:hypothetical protein
MLLAACALGLCPALLPTQVWVVDDQPGPGVDFTSLQAAADAASPGDLLLIKTGTYLGLTLNGKGLDLVAESDAQVQLLGGIQLQAIPADQRVLLRGLQVTPAEGLALQAQGSAGQLWFEDSEFHSGAPIQLLGFTPEIPAGGRFTDCPSIVIERCSFEGSAAILFGFFFFPSPGGHGLVLIGSRATVNSSTFRGRDGADTPDDEWMDGGQGGSGIVLQESILWAAGLETFGGTGGWGNEEVDGFTGEVTCGDGGNGGHGIHLLVSSTLQEPSQLFVRDHQSSPGAGGLALCASAGLTGLPIATTPTTFGHMVTPYAGSERGFYAASPVRVGTNARLYFQGEAGDIPFVGLGLAPTRLPLPGQFLPLLITPLENVLPLNPPGASGDSVTVIPVPLFGPSFSGATLFLQAAALEGGLNLQLAASSGLSLLGLLP